MSHGFLQIRVDDGVAPLLSVPSIRRTKAMSIGGNFVLLALKAFGAGRIKKGCLHSFQIFKVKYFFLFALIIMCWLSSELNKSS